MYVFKQSDPLHLGLLRALPYAALLWAFVPECCSECLFDCRPVRKERGLIASQVVYEKYFGLGGRYYAFKVAALQASTVLLQALGKMKLFGAALVLPEIGPAFFWMFVVLLVCNSIYPAVLLCWLRKRWALRAAVMDAALDVGYLFCFVMTAGQSWALLAPTDFLGYMAIYTNVAHCLCVCRALSDGHDPTGGSCPSREKGHTGSPVCSKAKSRAFAVCYSAILLSVVAGAVVPVVSTRLQGFSSDACLPCDCSEPDTHGLRRLESCELAVLMRTEHVDFENMNIGSIAPKALEGLHWLKSLDLGGNKLSSLPAGIFDGLTSLTSLRLSSNQLSSLAAGIFDGLTSLTSLDLDENQLTTLP
ncbi:LINGO4, partial [Symbiodinium necroappetens]